VLTLRELAERACNDPQRMGLRKTRSRAQVQRRTAWQ
jgi:hypothetical protein